ncbi:MAG: hypothetical protein HYY76_19515 [Acidobacteria bacterium]|nr:hypothetical protein [Acidobacteriota bacterium]
MTRTWSIRSAVAAWLIAGTWAMWPHETLSHNPITTTVLFNREIVALVQRKCLQCHRDGQMAMSLATYADARPWAVAIKEEVLARQMPPWPAEAGYGQFANDVGLTTREMDFLLSWVEGGAPEGIDLTPPAFVDHSSHWMLGQPQTMATARQGVTVEANSAPRFHRVLLDPGLTRETWVKALDYRPGDPRVARAAFFTVVETGEYLGAWTPWHSSTELPGGVAFRLPPRARIAVDVLYRGAGDTVVDTPTLALYTTPEPPMRRASTAVVRASAASGDPLRLSGRLVLPRATTLFALRPEMQQGGRTYEVTALLPDGSREVLLRVQRFRFDWQTPFIFRQPVSLPAGSVLEATAEYEESAAPASRTFAVTITQYPDVPARVPLMTAHDHEHGSASVPGALADRPAAPADAADAGDGETAWFCPMHPDVTSSEPGQCRKCGMTLVSGRPFDTRDYRLAVSLTPRAMKAGIPVRMRFDVRHPSSDAQVRNFELVHDRRYHLFVVSHDMREFQHLHPDQQADGAWTLDVTLPKPGAYRVISDFLPTGGAPQLLARTLVTADFAGELRSQDARLEVDTAWKKTVGPLSAELTFDPPRLVAGQYGHLAFRLSDATTGEPVTDLQPYLGAFGHAFVLSEDLRDSVHSHPPEWRDGREISTGFGGPEVMFEGYMPRPGRYRVWAQFLRRGELVTIPFTFQVFTLDEVFGRR